MSAAMSTAATPVARDTRPPWMSRLRTSRPTGALPSRQRIRRSAVRSLVPMAFLVEADARVEPADRDVDGQVHQDDDEGHHQDGGLRQRVVEVPDGRDGQTAQAGPG